LIRWAAQRSIRSSDIGKPRTETVRGFSQARSLHRDLEHSYLLKKLIYLGKFAIYVAMQVTGQGCLAALSRGDDTYFTMNLQNNRQCPAGGFSFSRSSGGARIACWRRIRTGLLTGSGHYRRVNIFRLSRRLHVLQTFCVAKCRSASRPCASGSFLVSISLRRRLFIFLSGTRVLLLKERWVSPEAEFARWRPKTSNWRSESPGRGGIFAFPLRAPSGTRYGGEGRLRVGLVAVGWREGNKNRCLILQSLAAALAA
jgi:hypothetical protein